MQLQNQKPRTLASKILPLTVPILYAELQIAGRQVACEVASFSFVQPTDEKGRPSSVVRIGLLQVIISGEPAGWPLWEEIKFDSYRRESGHLVFFQNEGITAKRYTFYDAALVYCQLRYDGKGKAGQQPALQVELHFSAATIELDGIRLEAHSLIPWETDAQTSFRALTKPADPLPSAHLAAGAGLVATSRLKAEEVGTGLIKKVLTPAGEVGTEIAGVSVAAIGRTAALLPSLLLTPTNSPDDPGYASEWELYRRNNHPDSPIPLPPPPDKVRLAQLERALAAQTLTAQEEDELISLLAKVKGIFVNQLAYLTPGQRAAVKPPLLDPKKKPLYGPTIRKWHQKGGTIEVLPGGNWKYTDWLGNYVVYEGDEPNFDHFARQQVDIDGMTGDCTSDFAAANKTAPLGRKLRDNTWHHKQNARTMQEVPTDIHERFTHYGARHVLKKAQAGPTKLIKRPRPS